MAGILNWVGTYFGLFLVDTQNMTIPIKLCIRNHSNIYIKRNKVGGWGRVGTP